MPLFGLVQTRNSLHKFLILRTYGRQTRSDKLGNLISTTPMFSEIEAKTSPRRPSQFEAMYKFCADTRPDFPVPYLTLKEHLHIRQQSFARFTLFFTASFGVSAPSIKKFDCESLHLQCAVMFVYILLR